MSNNRKMPNEHARMLRDLDQAERLIQSLYDACGGELTPEANEILESRFAELEAGIFSLPR